MISKNELKSRVTARKQELAAENEKLTLLSNKITAFIEDIKSRSVIYNLVKNLPLWKELEQFIK